MPLDGKRTQPANVALKRVLPEGKGAILSLIIFEGRNRQIRRMCESVGQPVSKLKRIRIGPVTDPKIRPGEFRDLDDKEIAALKRAAAKDPQPKKRPRS